MARHLRSQPHHQPQYQHQPFPAAWNQHAAALPDAAAGLTVADASNERTPWQRPRAPEPEPETGSLGPAAELGHLEDRYELYEEIARGGMATVHLGRSVEPGVPRVVAIKQLHSQLAWNPSFVAMFLDEGRLAARVHHPNVVAPLDFVVRAPQGELCLVMEYVHGETLSHLLNRSIHSGRAPSPAVAAGIMVGVLRGLQAAHEATTDDGTALEIVHRDVSPQNIMVGTDGVARVLDFGVARAKMQDLPTGERDRGGKPAYLAPEQIRFQKIDRRADLFSAGVVLWELLAGRRLFRHNDPRMVWVNILSGEIPPPSRFNPAVSPGLDQVVLQAMERDRSRRHPTARHFAQAIVDAVNPATAAEIGKWVQSVSGSILARRARRVAEVMANAHPHAAAGITRKQPTLAARLAGLLSFRRRWSGLGLLVAALTGMAISSGSSRALLQRPTPTAAMPLGPAHQTEFVPLAAPVAPKSVTPRPENIIPSSPPAARVETGPRAEAPSVGVAAATAAAIPVAPAAAPVAAATATAAEPSEAAAEDDDPLVDDGPTVFTVEDDAPASHDRKNRRQPSAAIARQIQLSRIADMDTKAMNAYRRGNFEAARTQLRMALTATARAHLQRHPLTAITHAYLGIVMVNGFKQPQLGVEQFRQALRIDPNVPLSRRYAKPAVAAAFREAVART